MRALGALLLVGTAHAATLSVAPHLAELAPDGFVVAFETDVDSDAAVEVARQGAFASAGKSHGQVHRIRVHGLSPSESVGYRVLVDGHVLAEAHARSGPPDDAPALDFLVYGDTRDGRQAEAQGAVEAHASAPAFAIHTGDIVPRGDDEAAWKDLFTVEQPLLAEAPLYLALGNHELVDDASGAHARRFMPPPGDGPAYYTFRVGPARFLMLDSTRLDATQLAWVDKSLSEAVAEVGHPHVFVVLHHPPFSTGSHCGSYEHQGNLVALLEKYRPSAVFAGHDHAYERLERNGVRYFVSGGGGAPLYSESAWCTDEDRAARRTYRAEHHLVKVHVRGEEVEVEAVRLGGMPIETVRFVRGEPLVEGPSNEPPPSRLLSALSIAGGVLLLVAIGLGLRRALTSRRGS